MQGTHNQPRDSSSDARPAGQGKPEEAPTRGPAEESSGTRRVAAIDEDCRRRFEAAWREAAPVSIDSCLPPADNPLYVATLEELVHIEMEMLWRGWGRAAGKGEATEQRPPLLEAYLLRFPVLNQGDILERLAKQEFLVRQLQGDAPSCAEYRQRFPALALDPETLSQAPKAGRARAIPMPAQLGPYRIVKVLGAGGMGIVYQGEDTHLQRHVALKVMRPDTAQQEDSRQRFLREARAAAALSHDNIVTIYLVGEDKGMPFLAMPLLEGESLEDRLRRDDVLPIAEVLQIGRQTAEGLAAAHARGLIHRDIKPANIWLEKRRESRAESQQPGKSRESRDERRKPENLALDSGLSALGSPPALDSGLSALDFFRVKIMDFGLARAAESDATLTGSGIIVGTPAYMAPEQARAEQVDGRADLFSLGCMLYRMCTGQLPFVGKDAMSTLLAVAQDQPPPPARINPAVPASLSNLIMELLAKARDQRPGWAQGVANRLDQMERELALQRSGAMGRGRGVPRRALVAAAFVAVVVAVVGGFFLWQAFNPQGESADPGNPGQVVVDPPKPGTSKEPSLLPLKDWLAKKVASDFLTVAQDGSAMYKTIGAAIDALKPGQVVKVLDKGPYREALSKVFPEDSGLVSEVGTRIEFPPFKKVGEAAPPAKGGYYVGQVMSAMRGLRLSGFEIVAPKLENDVIYATMLTLQIGGDVVVESCRLLHQPAYALQHPGPGEGGYQCLVLAGPPGKHPGNLVLRDNYLEGQVTTTEVPIQALVEHNHIVSWRHDGVRLNLNGGQSTVRNNVIQAAGHGVVYILDDGPDAAARDKAARLTIINNLLEANYFPAFFVQLGGLKPTADHVPSQVTIQNNVVRVPRGMGLVVGLDKANKLWRLGHNCFQTHLFDQFVLPRQSTDLVVPTPFLSEDPKDLDRFRRIAAGGPLATGGVGGDFPVYMGPFPPGPAPAGGDWFTRLYAAGFAAHAK